MDNCQAYFFFQRLSGCLHFLTAQRKLQYTVLRIMLPFFFFIAADRFYDIVDVQSPDQYLEACYPFKLCDCQILDIKIFWVKHYWVS